MRYVVSLLILFVEVVTFALLTMFYHDDQNACSWLARSGETHDYDLLSVSKDDWQVWTGKVQTFELSIKCNDCFGYSDCNYHGTCTEDRRCECLDSVSTLDDTLALDWFQYMFSQSLSLLFIAFRRSLSV